jgi:hypothetical protein
MNEWMGPLLEREERRKSDNTRTSDFEKINDDSQLSVGRKVKKRDGISAMISDFKRSAIRPQSHTRTARSTMEHIDTRPPLPHWDKPKIVAFRESRFQGGGRDCVER